MSVLNCRVPLCFMPWLNETDDNHREIVQNANKTLHFCKVMLN